MLRELVNKNPAGRVIVLFGRGTRFSIGLSSYLEEVHVSLSSSAQRVPSMMVEGVPSESIFTHADTNVDLLID